MTTNNLKSISKTIDYTSMVQEPGDVVFKGLMPAQMKVPVFANRHPLVPASNPLYFPDPKVFRVLMKWMFAPKRQIGFGLWGETRTGKTEMVRYVCDKLNWPLAVVSCHSDLRPYHLEGQSKLIDGPKGVITDFQYAAVAKAYRDGHVLLLDEVDKLSADVTAKLHLLAEGKPWPIEETGEIINPHPNFRLVGTANTNGSGDSDRYLSSNAMDEAFRRRWGWVKTDFLSKEKEVEIIKAVTNDAIPTGLAINMCETAQAMRKLLKSDTPINTVIGTGTLTQWAEWIINFGVKSQIQESLDFCLLNGTNDDEVEDIKAVLQRVWGDGLTMTLGDWVAGK